MAAPAWNHPGVIRGIVEAFYDPLGSWDISTGTGGFGGPIGNHMDHVHLSINDPETMIYMIDYIQSLGMRVGENPYVDPVDGNHVNGSFHYQTFEGLYNGRKLGKAIDITGSTGQMAWIYNFATKYGKGDKLPTKPPKITYTNGAQPTAKAPEAPVTQPRMTAPFFEMVLRGLNVPVTESNMRFLAGWARGAENTWAKNNPFATTLVMHDANGNELGDNFNNLGNGIHVKNYPTPEIGVRATVETLDDYKAIVRLLGGGDASRMIHGNKAAYEDLNYWASGHRGRNYATSYTNNVESWLMQVDPYKNPKDITDGDYPNLTTPENSPATGQPPPSDVVDKVQPVYTPSVDTMPNVGVPIVTPDVVQPGLLYNRAASDPVYSNMLTDVWAQVSSVQDASAESMRFASLYGLK